MRVHNKEGRSSNNKVTWRDTNVTKTDGKRTDLSESSSLSYDGNMNIFLSDYFYKTIRVFSVNGQFYCQLLSLHHIKKEQCRLALNEERQLLFVGQKKGCGGGL